MKVLIMQSMLIRGAHVAEGTVADPSDEEATAATANGRAWTLNAAGEPVNAAGHRIDPATGLAR